MDAPAVRVSVYRNGGDVFIRVLADTAVGPKGVAVRIENAVTTEVAEHLTDKMARSLARAEIPRLDPEEIERRLKDDRESHSDIMATVDAHQARVLARRAQYVEAIGPRLSAALAAA
jgi:hypothetical protein